MDVEVPVQGDSEQVELDQDDQGVLWQGKDQGDRVRKRSQRPQDVGDEKRRMSQRQLICYEVHQSSRDSLRKQNGEGEKNKENHMNLQSY